MEDDSRPLKRVQSLERGLLEAANTNTGQGYVERVFVFWHEDRGKREKSGKFRLASLLSNSRDVQFIGSCRCLEIRRLYHD